MAGNQRKIVPVTGRDGGVVRDGNGRNYEISAEARFARVRRSGGKVSQGGHGVQTAENQRGLCIQRQDALGRQNGL